MYRLLRALPAALAMLLTPAEGLGFYTTVQNDYYVINVVDNSAGTDSIGAFQLHTGALHPAGANQQITFANQGNVNIGTSFSGIRVGADNARVYTNDAKGAGAANPVQDLDDYYASEGPTPGHAGAGWRTEWDLAPESLEITQDILTVGNSFGTSAIYHTVEIKNDGSETALVEWLNLLDFDTMGDAGPNMTVERPDGQVFADGPHEYTHGKKADEFVRVSDYPTPGGYDAFWTLTHEPGLLPLLGGEALAITPADQFQLVAWSAAFNPANFLIPENVFDYATDPTLDVATSLDTAGISLFQAVIPAGESYRVTQVVWAAPVPEPASGAALLLGLIAVASRRRGA